MAKPADPGKLVLSCHIQPGAKRSAFVGMYGDKIKISVASPPVDGKANRSLIRFLSESFGVPAASVRLLSGETSRDKRFEITGENPAARLAQLLAAQRKDKK